MEDKALRFKIVGTDLTYTVPDGVTNPPVFSVSEGNLIVVSRGYFPKESVFSVNARGEFTIQYDLSAYSKAERDAFEAVRSLMGLVDSDLTLDSYILFYLMGVERFILNYCALKSMPPELYYVWVEMVAAKAQANRNGFASFSNAVPTTVKDGSQSVSYGSAPAASVAGLSAAERDEFLNGWGHQLRQFRRIKWG